MVQSSMSGLLLRVAQNGPESLAEEAQALLNTESNALANDLLSHISAVHLIRSSLVKSVLQPYARWLAETRTTPVGRELAGGERTCPFCGGRPQVSFLQSREWKRRERQSRSVMRNLSFVVGNFDGGLCELWRGATGEAWLLSLA